jgi:hypothetical protein
MYHFMWKIARSKSCTHCSICVLCFRSPHQVTMFRFTLIVCRSFMYCCEILMVILMVWSGALGNRLLGRLTLDSSSRICCLFFLWLPLPVWRAPLQWGQFWVTDRRVWSHVLVTQLHSTVASYPYPYPYTSSSCISETCSEMYWCALIFVQMQRAG